MGFTAWDQSYWWRTKQDYSFGWLVPLFAAYVVRERWSAIRNLAFSAGPTGDRAPSWPPMLIRSAAPIMLALGITVFLVGAFYRAAADVTHLSSLLITLGMVGCALPIIYYLAPAGHGDTWDGAARKWSITAQFLFPVLVWLVSAPLLSTVDDTVAVYLMHQVTSIVFFVFDRLGLPLEQRGNVLVLPTGSVGVEEACSGVRSLTGCLFAGTFLAAVFVRTHGRKLLLVVSSLLFAFGANLLRSVFLTAWAYYHGAASIEGTIHDSSGYAVLGLAIVAMLAILPFLERRGKRDRSRE